jgi:hypothetical protein
MLDTSITLAGIYIVVAAHASHVTSLLKAAMSVHRSFK